MAIDSASPRTRRALLSAALGAGAATVASALGRPLPARADNGGAVILGTIPAIGVADGTGVNEAMAGTGIYTTSGNGFLGWTSQADFNGLFGWASAFTGSYTFGVFGQSDSATGAGVRGLGRFGVDGEAYRSDGSGVRGRATSSTGSTHGVFGQALSPSGTGVTGVAGGSVPAVAAGTGVHGYATADTASRGVYGQTTAGRGVQGSATSGTGVHASATTGYAIRSSGRVRFDKSAGVATIAAGTKSVVVTPGIDLTSTSAVVASLMGSAGGTTTVHRSVVSTGANTITIYLTANSTANVKVAWHTFG